MGKKKRDLLQIYFEVLKELSQGPMRLTHIMRKCNIDTRLTKQVISTLTSRDLIEIRSDENSRLYYITDKGVKFLELYEDLQRLVQS